MKIIKTVLQIGILYFIFLLGSWIQKTLNLFIPGSIIGMLLLFMLLATGIFKQDWIEKGSVLLIKFLPLLFLPVTVGIISFPQFFKVKGFLLILVILLSTALVMISTGMLSQRLLRKGRYENE